MTKRPTIAQLRHVLQFDRPVKSSDGTGGQQETYGNWFTCRGFMQRMNGLRSFQSGYDESVNVYTCHIPWRNEIEANLSKDVVVNFEGRSFSVETFHRVDENRNLMYLELKEVR